MRPWTSPRSTPVAHGEGGPPSTAVSAGAVSTQGWGVHAQGALGYGGPTSSPATGNKGSLRPRARRGRVKRGWAGHQDHAQAQRLLGVQRRLPSQWLIHPHPTAENSRAGRFGLGCGVRGSGLPIAPLCSFTIRVLPPGEAAFGGREPTSPGSTRDSTCWEGLRTGGLRTPASSSPNGAVCWAPSPARTDYPPGRRAQPGPQPPCPAPGSRLRLPRPVSVSEHQPRAKSGHH